MSAIAEAPKTEAPPAQATPTIEPVTFNMQDALKAASRNAAMGRKGWTPSAQKPDEIKKELETPPPKKEEVKEEPKEEKKEEVKETEKVAPPAEDKKAEAVLSPKASDNFKLVLTRAEAAEAKQKELEAELEKARKEPPAEFATKLSDYEKQLEHLRKREAELTEKVRSVDVTLDPKFNEDFTQPLVNSQRGVLDMMVQAGVSKEEATAAVTGWNYAEMDRLTEGLTGIEKRLIDAQILETERLAKVRNSQIQKPEDYQARRRQQDEEQQKRTFTERERTANAIFTGLIDATPELKGDEYKPLRETITKELSRASRGEIPVNELMGKIAQAEVLQVALQGQHAALVEQDKRIKELEKERDDLNAFVKANGGSSLKSETVQGDGGGPFVPIWKRIAVK